MYHLARDEGVERPPVLAELARVEVLDDEVGVVAQLGVAARGLHHGHDVEREWRYVHGLIPGSGRAFLVK